MIQDPVNICRALVDAGTEDGFESMQYGAVGGFPLLALRRQAAPSAPHLYVSAGVHGDEPAAIYTALELLKAKRLPRAANITICPLVNPTGFAAGRRENEEGIDLNRDFKQPQSVEIQSLVQLLDSLPSMDLSLCLHEDWEATGFYLYYINPDSKELAQQVISRVAQLGPIEPAEEVDGRSASGGIIHPEEPFDPDSIAEGWPEAFYLYTKWRHDHFTLETPSGIEMAERVKMASTAAGFLLNQISSSKSN